MKPARSVSSFLMLLSALLLPSMAFAQVSAPASTLPTPATPAPATDQNPTAALPSPIDIGAGKAQPGATPPAEPKAKTYAAYETTPLEIALLYYKLLKQEPPYENFILNNELLLKKTDGFGQSAQLNQQRQLMKKLYDDFNDMSVITSSSKVTIVSAPMDTEIVTLTGLAPDLPLIYKLNNDERYGIFIRNAKETNIVSPPYVTSNINMLVSSYNGFKNVAPVELLLKPIIADEKNFTLNTGTSVRVIVADLVELRIMDRQNQHILLQKRFKGWKPEAELKAESDSLISPDLVPHLKNDAYTKELDK